MKKPLFIATSVVFVAALYWILSHRDDSGEASTPVVHRPVLTASSPVTSSTSPPHNVTDPKQTKDPQLPVGWSPFVSSKLELSPDLAERLELTEEQMRQLGIFRNVFLRDAVEAMSHVAFNVIPVQRPQGDPRAADSVSETAIFFPAQRPAWQGLESVYKQKLNTILGTEKAAVFREAAGPVITPLTGNFGRTPQLGIIALKNGKAGSFYHWTIATGPQAFSYIAGAQLGSNDISAQSLESQLLAGTSFSAAESFTEIPEYLDRILVSPEK